jgi:hypothetical protein
MEDELHATAAMVSDLIALTIRLRAEIRALTRALDEKGEG